MQTIYLKNKMTDWKYVTLPLNRLYKQKFFFLFNFTFKGPKYLILHQWTRELSHKRKKIKWKDKNISRFFSSTFR